MPDADYLLIPLPRRDRSIRAHAMIDVADAHLAEFNWGLCGRGYPKRHEKVDGVQLAIYLHREVLGLTRGDGLEGDHIDGNPLNARRSNLRVSTHAQNRQNTTGHPNATSRYRGVCLDRRNGRWRAEVMIKGKRAPLGSFNTEEEAAAVARAYRLEHMPFTNEARSDR